MVAQRDEIQEQFNKVIIASQGIQEPKTDRLFDVWQKNKQPFIDALGGKLIYEIPETVTFDLSEKGRHDRVSNFISQVFSYWNNEELSYFIESQEDGFFKNLTISDYTTNKGVKIKAGSKLVKAFKHFFEKDSRSLIDIQNEASRIIQEDKVEGKLCLSVHPLDYLSLSENTYNWRSCHALDGEYRAGNLSYMMDNCTVICYLKGEEDVCLPGFCTNEVRWNSKKWRVLIHISEDWRMVISGRQYPFESKTGIDLVLKQLLPTLEKFTIESDRFGRTLRWSEWQDEILESYELKSGFKLFFNHGYIPICEELVPLDKVVKVGDGAKNYNDVLYSSCYKPIYAFKYVPNYWEPEIGSIMTDINTTKFTIGEYTFCLRCGEEECITGADSMLCESCEFAFGHSENDMFTHCDNCGCRMYADDGYYVGDEIVCRDCFDRHCQTCDVCGETDYKENIRYCEETDQYLCKYCAENSNN